MHDSETLTLRDTVIGGQRQVDDFTMIWRGMPIGRIKRSSGVRSRRSRWWWGCNVYGQPSLDGDSEIGVDLDDGIVKFMIAWARIHAGLTDDDIARAHEYAEASAEALARYDRKRGT
jgi:hypothetical protein